jgi:repressor LexA
MRALTRKQEEIMQYLTAYTKEHGYPPTMREIGHRFGFLWSAARVHLLSLQKKGLIRINPSTSRGIEILGLKPREGFLVPVAGRIRAGAPVLAAEDIDAHILVDRSLFPGEDSFSLRVAGDSMIEAGIFDGDYVIVKPQSTIKSGEIGVVLIGDEATVKRIVIARGNITLKPENRALEPVTYDADNVRILGKVIGVIRRLP